MSTENVLFAMSLTSGIDVSLSLVMSRQITKSVLFHIKPWESLYILGATTVLVSLMEKGAKKTEKFSGVQDSLSVLKRVLILTMNNIFTGIVKSSSRRKSKSIETDIVQGLNEGNWIMDIPSSAWIPVQVFLSSCLLLVTVAFVSRASNGFQHTPTPNEGMRRLVISIQWLFADTVGSLLPDQWVKWDTAIVGLFLLSKITFYMETDSGGVTATLFRCVVHLTLTL